MQDTTQKTRSIRLSVFIPGVLLVSLVAIVALFQLNEFDKTINFVFSKVMHFVSWIFGPSVIFFMGIMCSCIFGKVGRVVIGGFGASHILRPFSFYSVVITSITATGMLFYGVSEPVFHLMNPQDRFDIIPGSDNAIVSAMGITLLHWTFAGFSIYSVLSIAVALGVYNLGYHFSLSAALIPIFGQRMRGTLGAILDVMILFSAILGGIFVLGQVLLSISYGFSYLFGIKDSIYFNASFTLIIMVSALLCLKSGFTKAVKRVANANMFLYYGMLLFFIVAGPMLYCIGISLMGFSYYLDNFFTLTINNGSVYDADWANVWTIAHLCSWAGYGPIMALFLAKIARGYTIRQFTFCIFLGGSAFYYLWFAVFGGCGIEVELTHGDIYKSIVDSGFESGIYAFFEHYPATYFMVGIYVFVSIISFVSTLIGQLDGLASLCATSTSAKNIKPPFFLVIFWAVAIGFLAFICASFLGFRGVRIFASFSGVVGIFICIASGISLVWIFMHTRREKDCYIIDTKSIRVFLFDYFLSGINFKRQKIKVQTLVHHIKKSVKR